VIEYPKKSFAFGLKQMKIGILNLFIGVKLSSSLFKRPHLNKINLTNLKTEEYGVSYSNKVDFPEYHLYRFYNLTQKQQKSIHAKVVGFESQRRTSNTVS